jgi:hypothetical protein
MPKVSAFILGWFAGHKLNITKREVPNILHCLQYNIKNVAADRKTRSGVTHSSCGLGTPDLVVILLAASMAG